MTASWSETRSSSTTSCYPERFKEMPENQLYWTQRWADQMNYRYWKERCQAESDDQRRCWRGSSSTRGRVAYKTGDFPKAADEVQGRARGLEDRHERISRPIATTS